MKWYGDDFKNAAPSIPAYINKYSKTKIKEGVELKYMDYSWDLNEKK